MSISDAHDLWASKVSDEKSADSFIENPLCVMFSSLSMLSIISHCLWLLKVDYHVFWHGSLSEFILEFFALPGCSYSVNLLFIFTFGKFLAIVSSVLCAFITHPSGRSTLYVCVLVCVCVCARAHVPT